MVPFISWGAIFGGLFAGVASFLLLALFGLAAGITAVNPQAAQPVGGGISIFAWVWTWISMFAGGFIGAYVAARTSGMSRRTDGLLHGFVAWGVSTLFFAYLITSGTGAVLGGAFSLMSQGTQATAGSTQQLQSLITGSPRGQISGQALGDLQRQLQAGNREGAIGVLVREMGFARDRAAGIVDRAMPLMAGRPGAGQRTAQTAVQGLTWASWYLFIGILFSMLLSLGGGYLGAKAIGARRTPLPSHAERAV
ncbi:MAG: hypothetical protein M0017_05060 [Desulfobacteraceae bacterium]|nr:hypothetical protein [Desulfobacteraceae bacterium]